MKKTLLSLFNKIENVFKIRRTRNLTVQGKITIFKTFAISKVIHLALVSYVPDVIIDELKTLSGIKNTPK